MMQEYLVPEEAAGTRIDKFLADALPGSVPFLFAETSEREQRDSRRKSGKSQFQCKWRGNYRL